MTPDITQTQVDPSATTQIPADAQLTELQNETHDDAANDGDKAPQSDLDKTIRKLQRRIDSRTRGLGERDARIAQLERELQARQSQRTEESQGEGAPTPKPLSEADIERRAAELADARVYQESISSKTKAMLTAGKEFEGFQELAAEVAQEIPFLDRSGKPTPFIEDILDRSPKVAAELLTYLGRNPDVLADLAEMTARQQTRKLALLETELAKKPEKRSHAPKPIEPLNGNAKGDPDPSEMTDKQFSAWRKTQIAQRR